MTEGHNYGERPERPGRRRKYHRGPCGSFTSTRRRQHALIGRSAPSPARARARAARPRVNIFIGEAGREGKEEKRRKNDRTTGYPSSNRAFSSLHFSSLLPPPFFFSLLFFRTEISAPLEDGEPPTRWVSVEGERRSRDSFKNYKTSSSPAFTGEFGKAGRGGK